MSQSNLGKTVENFIKSSLYVSYFDTEVVQEFNGTSSQYR